jgi:hypothetical protein
VKFQRGINVFGTIFSTSVLLTITATTIFHQTPDRKEEPTTLATVEIVNQPDTSPTGFKKIPEVKTPHKKPSTPKKRVHNSSSRIKISGYRGKTFVYGEVIPLKNGKLQGFIYHPNDSKTYVYGERGKDRMNLYDNSGNLYQMLY